jgi:hypothetical protein
MPHLRDDERKQSPEEARLRPCTNRASRDLDDTLLCDLKDVLVNKQENQTVNGNSKQKKNRRHDIGDNNDDDDSVVILESFPSPQNGKIVSDVEYNPSFWVVQRGQLTPNKLTKARIDATAGIDTTTGTEAHSVASVARGTSNAASHASLLTTTSSTRTRSRDRGFGGSQVMDIEYNVDFWDVQGAKLISKADPVVEGDGDVKGKIQQVPAAVYEPEEGESPVAETPLRKRSVITRSQQVRGRSRERSRRSSVLEVEKVKEVPKRKPSRRRSRGAKRTGSDSAHPGSAPRRRLRSERAVPSPGSPDDEDDDQRIRIGLDFQASIPARDITYPHSESSEDHGDVLWDPSLAQAATQSGEDVEGCLEQGSEMNAKFLLMEALHKKQYCLKNARTEFNQLCRNRGEFSVELNSNERALAHKMFREQAGRGKQKDFTGISKALGRKKDTLLVNYYRWKAEGRAYREAKKGRESEVCSVCDDGGFLLVCDACRSAFHLACLKPALSECPETDWCCDRCKALSTSKSKRRLSMSPSEKSPRKSIMSPTHFKSPFRDRSKESSCPPSRSSLFLSGNRKKEMKVPPARSSSEERDDRKRELAYVHKELGTPKPGASSRRWDVALVAPAAAKKTGIDDCTYTSPSIASADVDVACHSRSLSSKCPPSTGQIIDLTQDDDSPQFSTKATSTPGNTSPDTGSSYHDSDTSVSDNESADAKLLLEERVSKDQIPKRQNAGGAKPTTAHHVASSNSGPTMAKGLSDIRQVYVDGLPTRQGPALNAAHDGLSNNVGITPAHLAFLAGKHAEGNAIGTNQGGTGLNSLGGFAASSGPASRASTNQALTGLNTFGGYLASGSASRALTNQGATVLNTFGGYVANGSASQTSTNQMGIGLNNPSSFLSTSSGPASQASTNQGVPGWNNLGGFVAPSSGPASQASRNQLGVNYIHNRLSNNVGNHSAQTSLVNGNASFGGLAAAALNGPTFQWGPGLTTQSSNSMGSSLAQAALAFRTTGHFGSFTSGPSTGNTNVGGPASEGPNRGGTGFDVSNNSGHSVAQSSQRNGNANADASESEGQPTASSSFPSLLGRVKPTFHEGKAG